MCILFISLLFFCLYHLMSLINLMVVAMYCLVESGASGDYLSSCVFC